MTEKTQFTPEDVGRTFETSKAGVTATLIEWDHDTKTEFKCLFEFSNGQERWCDTHGITNEGNEDYIVFPSRPVEEAPSQPTIDTEVEELARELFIHSDEVYYPDIAFKEAEAFIKFRNERRAGK